MIVLFIVATTTTLGAFGAHRQWQLQQDLEQRFERTRAEVLEGLKESLAAPAWALNVGILRTRLESTLIHPEVTEACVFSPDRQEVYADVRRTVAAGRPPSPGALPCAAANGRDVLAEITLYPPDNIDPERRNQAIGTAVIRLTRDNMHETLRAAMVQGVTEVAAIDVALILLLTFGLRMVFRPIEHLRGALLELASTHGDHLDELARLGRTEFDSVIDAFNLVLRRLKLIIAQRTEAEMAARAATQTSNEAFAQIQATQAELVEKNRQLEALSKTDQLTGVFNRRHLNDVLTRALERTRRDGSLFSIILIDVDRFKSVNDTHGHQVGDRVLVEMAGRILDAKRATDTVGRWGGEEFLLICADTGLQDAVRFAQRLRNAVSERDFYVTGRMTASLGVACVQEGDTIHGMISRADEALYRSKELGRNRVEYAADGIATMPDGEPRMR
ncbi:diguanylate cyclase (GGDEF) domain-containing protein [Cupriavidus sp. YR651]|uniref:GGDEF domain-containing protein n=1 Tax=Cupriavidus sp. YR651 TaxID=1855315 RepID=UPI000890682C|nr:diguanylate cyclase [Cupriavidus sp. YR651]SDC68270.1 diguanylate cyclase (GGDEF) domain-containing protein [Cupriavidus sp. YR651]